MDERSTYFNPFPGLRPFESQEDYLFFGRETHVDELLRRLRQHRFLSIVGASGSGKSSLVRAGLLTSLYGGFMAKAGSRWRVAIFRPGSDPMGHLAEALNRPDVFGREDSDKEMSRAMMEATLRRSSLGLIEAARQAHLPSGENLLLVVDQFEELFRYRSALQRKSFDDASAFVRLLIEASRREQVPIYVALTMRSDFLGDCAQFHELPEMVNEGQYLIPRLTRDQIRQAIVGPIAVGGGEIAPNVVELLLNDVGDNPDHLPVLQHALMRTWDFWVKDHAAGEPIRLRHYEAIGGMGEALSRHADEAFNELGSDAERRLAERLFRNLTERGSDNREIRRPMRLADLSAAIGAPEEEVRAVVDRFRRHDRSFLMPPADRPLAPDTMIDISHESLMRVWTRLRDWVDEEARSAETYRRVAETAALHEQGRAGLWRDPDLAVALSWRENDRPNPAWAMRYAPGFERAMAFLDASREAAEAERAAAEAHRRRELRRIQLSAATLGVAFVLSLVFLVYALNQARLARSRQLALESAQQLDADPELSLLLAIEAARAKGSREAEGALRAALVRPGRVWRLLAAPEAHKEMWYVAWSPDRRRLVTTGRDGVVRLWNLYDRRGPETLGAHSGGVLRAAWDPAGRRILTASFDGTARIWDPEKKRPPVALRGHASAVNRAAWDASGRRIATASLDGTVRVWDAASGAPLGVLRGHAGNVLDVAWSPDGTRLASAGQDGTARVWDVDAPAPAAVLSGHTDEVTSVAWSPDGRWIATASLDRRWRVWDPQSGREESVGEGQGGLVQVAWSPDGQLLATAGKSGLANLWEWRGGSLREVLAGHASELTGVSWDRTGARLLTSGLDGTARVWDTRTGSPLAVMSGHSGGVKSAVWDPVSLRVATAGQDGTARVWDVDVGWEVAVTEGPAAAISRISWDPAGKRLVSASFDGTARIWDAETGKELTLLRGSRLGTLDTAWEPAGERIVTADRDGIARLWRADGRLLATLRGHRAGVSRAAWSADGGRIATAGLDRTARVWEATSGRELRVLAGHTDWVRDVAWSPDGRRLATASFDTTARIWDLERRALPLVLSGHIAPVLFAAWSPDGKRLLTGSADRTARIWDAESGAQTALLVGHRDWLIQAAWSPGGSRIATAGADRTARIWDAESGEQEHLLQGHAGRLRHVVWSPDGERIATTSDRGEVRLWDAETGELHAMLQGHAGRVEQAAWRPDGERIATGSYDGTVRVFFRGVDDLMRTACQRAVRNLTEEEWRHFLTGPYHATCRERSEP